jgi:hypothetical protein
MVQKLNMMGKGSLTSTEVDGDVMKSVRMQNLKLLM